MAIENRADGVTLVRLADDPQFTADLDALGDPSPAKPPPPAVVLDMGAITYLNSSNLARLLRLRKRVITADGRLVLCKVGNPAMNVFHVTGLDKVFTLVEDEETAVEWAKVKN